MDGWLLKNNYVFDRNNLNIIKTWWLNIDRTNYLLIIFIMLFGLFMTATSSPYVASKIGVDSHFFVKKQIIFTSAAIIIFTFISFLQRDHIKVISIFGIITFTVLLFTVLAIGFEIKGSKRWIFILGFTLQPSEFAKVFFLIFNAFILFKARNQNWIIKYGISFALYALIASLFVLQPDLGMTFLLTITWLTQLFILGLSMIFIFLALLMGIIASIYAYQSFPHVASRINKFLDIDNKNYQVERSIDSYVNGGFFGTGPGNGLVKKHIPDVHTDFIFAAVSEEFGLIFAIALIFIFLIIVNRVIKRLMIEDDQFKYLAVTGLISLFALQILVNIGVSLAMLPTKGMTLPFISYGGSSILAMSICFGTILSLTKKKYDNKIEQKNIIEN